MPQVHVPIWKIKEHIDFIKTNRLDLEIYINSEALDSLTASDIRELKDKLHDGVTFTIHGPFMDLSPAAIDSKVRDVTLQRFIQVIEITRALSPKVIVFHSGYEKWKYGLRPEIWLENSIPTWKEVQRHISGTKVAIENIFEDEPSTLVRLMEGLKAEGLNEFGICFDCGHFNLFSNEPLSAWLEGLSPYIVELHLHDNDRLSDAHMPIGEGSFDFKSLFRALKDNKDIIHTIEAHSAEDALKSLSNLQNLLRDTLPDS